jgi:hypothetical protein
MPHSVLHAVQGRVHVVAVRQKGRQFRVMRSAPQCHHHGLRHLCRQSRTAHCADAVQDQVNTRGYARAAEHRPIFHKNPVGNDIAPGLHLLQFFEVLVVRGGTPPGQQTGMGRQHRARANRDQFHVPSDQTQTPQPVQHGTCCFVVHRNRAAWLTDQYYPAWRLPTKRRQSGQPRQRHTHRADGCRLGADKVQ